MSTRGRRAAGAAAPCLGLLVIAAVAHGAEAGPVASAVPVTITASTVDVGSLVYDGTVPVTTAAGTVQALRLELQDATFHGLTLTTACVPIRLGGLMGRTTNGSGTAATLTVYATEVLATVDGDRIRLSSTDEAYPPPPAGTSLVADGQLGDPVIVSLLASTASLHLATMTTTTSFCTPSGGGAALTGGVPLMAPPAVASTPTPAPDDAATPAAPSSDAPSATPTEEPSPSPTGETSPQPNDTPTPDAPPPSEPPPSEPPPSEPPPSEPTPSEPTPAEPTSPVG